MVTQMDKAFQPYINPRISPKKYQSITKCSSSSAIGVCLSGHFCVGGLFKGGF